MLLSSAKMVWLKWILTGDLLALQWAVVEMEVILAVWVRKVVKVVEVDLLIPYYGPIVSTISFAHPLALSASSVMVDGLVKVSIRCVDVSWSIKGLKISCASVSTLLLSSIFWPVSARWSSSMHIIIFTFVSHVIKYRVNVT